MVTSSLMFSLTATPSALAGVLSLLAVALLALWLPYIMAMQHQQQQQPIPRLAADPPKLGSLRRVWPKPSTSTHDGVDSNFNLNIVVVPEIGTPTVDKISSSHWAWLAKLSSAPELRAQILLFEYTLEKGDMLVWQSLARRSYELVDLLLDDPAGLGTLRRPVVFVSHGLGGIIVKQALGQPYGQGINRRFENLDTQSGVIFLGSPHLDHDYGIGPRNDWSTLPLLLRLTTNLAKTAIEQARIEGVLVANICRKFREAAAYPVISTYQTKPTKISTSFFRSRKFTLVPRPFAEIGLKYEKVFATDKPHNEANIVDAESNLFKAIRELLLQAASKNRESELPTRPLPRPIQKHVGTWATTDPDLDPKDDQAAVAASPQQFTSNEAVTGSTGLSGYEIVPGGQNLIQKKIAAQLPCYILGPEPRNLDFYGREDIMQRITGSFQTCNTQASAQISSEATPCAFALCGLGGVGKSQIALEFVHRHLSSYDAVFWIQADNDNSMSQSFERIAHELKLVPESEKIDPVISRNLVMEWLSRPVKSRPEEVSVGAAEDMPDEMASWLIVYDNADDLDTLHDFWPTTGNGCILVTSRDPLVTSSFTNMSGVDVDPFNPQESSELMIRLSGYERSEKNKAQSFALVNRLGGLPLALIQMAAVIRHRHMTFQEFLDIYEQDASNKELILSHEKFNHTLSTIFRLESFTPSARSLLNVMALMDVDALWESLFTHDLSQVRIGDFPSKRLDYVEARLNLIKSSIVRRSPNKKQLSLHRVTQDVTRAHMTPEQLRQAFETTINILLKSWPTSSFIFSHETALWGNEEKVVPHILSVSRIYEINKDLQLPVEVLRGLATLLQKGGWHVCEKGGFKVAEAMFTSSLQICEQHPEDMAEEYADSLFCIGSVASDTNRFELHMSYAKRHFDQRMKVEKQKPQLTLGAGLAHSEMALAHLLNNNYSEVIRYSLLAKEINEKTPEYLSGSYWPFFVFIHHAQALVGLGRHEEAEPMLVDTLKWRELKFGANDTESFKTGYALQVLGTVRQKQGRHDEALDMFRRALENYKATIGLSHHRTGHILVKLADENVRKGNFTAGLGLLNQALQIFDSYSLLYTPEIARTTFKKALVSEKLGMETEAARLFSQARALYSSRVPGYIGHETSLSLQDFDRIVAIWAR